MDIFTNRWVMRLNKGSWGPDTHHYDVFYHVIPTSNCCYVHLGDSAEG